MRKPARTVLGALLATLVVAGAAVAGPLEDADAADEQGDYATALRLWRPLAAQGNAVAQASLGFMYREGHGVVQNYVQAHMWFNLAGAYAGSDKTTREYAMRNRDLLAAKMTPGQIAEAQKLASEWKPKQ
jgi:TPR repeat protein